MTITPAEAEDIAAAWARTDSRRRGMLCTPHIDELSQGYAVMMRLPAGTRRAPGADLTTVIDRETGRLSHWPPRPPHMMEVIYNQGRDVVVGTHRTADPIAELRREAHRRVSPSVAAHVTLGGREFRSRGAKGDQRLVHHRLVAQQLAAITPQETVRGAERHAELLVVSDVLSEADKARATDGLPPLTLDEARDLLRQCRFETFHIRERGDSSGGTAAANCATCGDVLMQLAVIAPADRTYTKVTARTDGADPQPGRFPPEVAWELAAAGWTPGALADVELPDVEGAEHTLRPFPAAYRAHREFGQLAPYRNAPGLAQRVRWIMLGTGRMWFMADAMAQLGEIVGAPMYPLGAEGHNEAILAIDERGRVFALDQGGEWFIGETLDEAITALLTGLPAARLTDDGTWSTP